MPMNITQKDGLTLDISLGVTLSQDAPEVMMDERVGRTRISLRSQNVKKAPRAAAHACTPQCWNTPLISVTVCKRVLTAATSSNRCILPQQQLRMLQIWYAVIQRWESQRVLISDIKMSALPLHCLTTTRHDVKREHNTPYDPQRAACIATLQASSQNVYCGKHTWQHEKVKFR